MKNSREANVQADTEEEEEVPTPPPSEEDSRKTEQIL